MSTHRNPHLTIIAASVVIAAALIVSSLVIAPDLQTTKTITETSTSTVSQATSASSASSSSTSNGNATLPAPGSNTISLQGFRLCISVCPSPRPFLSGSVYVNNTSFLSSLRLFVNGTDEGTNSYAAYGSTNTLTDFSMEYSLTLKSPPIVAGDSYVLILVAVFQDNSTAAATTTVVAK